MGATRTLGGTPSLRLSIGGRMGKLELAGRDAWPATLEQVLDGITHQLSNRVALLASVSEILGRDDSIPPVLRALADEVPKLEETLRLLRLLAPLDASMLEPTEAPRLVQDAIALAHLHPGIRNTELQLRVAESVQPILVRPTVFTRDVLLAITAVVSALHDSGNGATAPSSNSVTVIPIVVEEDGDWIFVRVGDETSAEVRAPTLAAARERDDRDTE